MSVQLVPVGPETPPTIAALLRSHEDAIRELQYPTKPSPLWSYPTAAGLEAYAPADEYRDSACIVEDIHSIAVSTLVAGVYAWRRADGTAL